jgi:hypothetical protein
MTCRRTENFDNYRYGPRSTLVPGDRFRVTGGPVYVTDDGRMIPVWERGVFRFRCYCVSGASKWIEAYRGDGGGLAVLWVGRSCRSKAIPGLKRRPYKVSGKVHDKPPRVRRRPSPRTDN